VDEVEEVAEVEEEWDREEEEWDLQEPVSAPIAAPKSPMIAEFPACHSPARNAAQSWYGDNRKEKIS